MLGLKSHIATYHVKGQQVMKKQHGVRCYTFFVLFVPFVTLAQDAWLGEWNGDRGGGPTAPAEWKRS
jgi:hypothetical protein